MEIAFVTIRIRDGNLMEADWRKRSIIAFVKERFHNAVEIDILGIF